MTPPTENKKPAKGKNTNKRDQGYEEKVQEKINNRLQKKKSANVISTI